MTDEGRPSVSHASAVSQAGYMLIPNAVATRRDLRPVSKLLYGYLKHLAWRGRTENVDPRRETIADDLCVADHTVREAIRQLEKAPCCEGDTRPDAPMLVTSKRRGLGQPNTYLIRDPLDASSFGTEPADSAGLFRADQPNPPSSQDVRDKNKPVVARIYDHWRTARGKTRASYDAISPKRKTKIEARLKEFTEQDLVRAIDGVANDPWPERHLHDDLAVIFRSRDQVEKFLELADRIDVPVERMTLEEMRDYSANKAGA